MTIYPLIVRSLLILCLLIGSPSLRAQDRAEGSADTPRAGDRQPNRRFRESDRMLGMVPLLRIETVREELEVDDEQSRVLETFVVEISEDVGKQIRDLMQSFRDLSSEERRVRRREGNAETSQILAKVNERLKGVLSDMQFRRLKEIEVQRLVRTTGIGALASRDIAAALDLTDDQKQQLRDQAQDSRGQGRSISLDDVRAQVKEVLTAEQMEQLDTLFGAAFDLPRELLDRGRGRRSGGSPRGNREGGRRARPASERDQPAADGSNPE